MGLSLSSLSVAANLIGDRIYIAYDCLAQAESSNSSSFIDLTLGKYGVTAVFILRNYWRQHS